MKYINPQNNKGFTIIETLVAIAILMIAIAGPLTVAQKGLLAAVNARNQIIASYLGQDATEFIKNVRDNNLLNGREWLDKFSQCTLNNPCSINTLTGNPNAAAGNPLAAGISNCSAVNGICPPLYITANGYTPDSSAPGAAPSLFSRTTYIQLNPNNADEVKLITTLNWKNATVDNIITFESELFNVIK